MKSVTGLLAALLILVVMVAIVRDRSAAAPEQAIVDPLGEPLVNAPDGLIGTTTSAAFLLLGAWLCGELFHRLRMPRVSGYLIFGVLVGPELTPFLPSWAPQLVPAEQMPYLKLVDALAISVIALIAGGEIRIDFLRSVFRRIVIILGWDVVVVLVGVGGGLLLCRRFIEPMAEMSTLTAVLIALLVATFCVANSPAIVIAMVKESGSDGPMGRTALALTIFKDLCLIILFTALLATAAALIPSPEAATDSAGRGSVIGDIVWHLAGSIACGGVVGVVMQALGRRMGSRIDLFIVAAGFFIALLSDAIHLSPLLVGLAAGFVQANLWPDSSEDFFHAIEELSLPVYCLFFAVTGASIKVDAVVALWPVAVGIVVWRLILTYGAVRAGNAMAGFSHEGRWLWTALIPQAGVSIALATEIGDTFEDHAWSLQLTSLLLAVVAIHEIIGPPLMRLGLVRSGEMHTD